MMQSAFRNIGKALFVAVACLFVGCLRPSPVSEAEPGLTPELAFEIDTGLFHVGDSWIYQTNRKAYDPPYVTETVSRIIAKYVILEKVVRSGKRIDFLMEVHGISEDLTPMNPDSGKTTETRKVLSYSQSKWGLSTQWHENLPDSMLYYEPGEFLDFRYFESDSRTCHLGGETLACKPRRLWLAASSVKEDCQSFNQCSHNFPAITFHEALIVEGLGLTKAEYRFNYMVIHEGRNTRLVSKNGIAVPDSIGIEEP